LFDVAGDLAGDHGRAVSVVRSVLMPGKIVKLDEGVVSALEGLAKDQMRTFQELADEAFAALLKKHDRPVDLKDALRKSVRMNGKHVVAPARKKKAAKKRAA
jgi:ABC-type polar amino acid transport system ATPase subunit